METNLRDIIVTIAIFSLSVVMIIAFAVFAICGRYFEYKEKGRENDGC